jgi:hypothetical protein
MPRIERGPSKRQGICIVDFHQTGTDAGRAMTDEQQRIKNLETDYYAEKSARLVLEARVKYLEDELVLLKTDHSLLKRKLHLKGNVP